MLLKMQLDNLLWQDKDQINVGELWKLFCTYCYLPRLASADVLKDTIQRGVNSEDFFAYAEGYDGTKYIGLKYNQYVGFIDPSGYIVKQIAALKQLAADKPVVPELPESPPQIGPGGTYREDPNAPGGQNGYDPGHPGDQLAQEEPPKPENTRFFLTTTLDNTRVIKNVGNLMDEVINHLMSIEGASVEIKLLVDATMPNGTPVPIVRTVTENCRTLQVEDSGFQE